MKRATAGRSDDANRGARPGLAQTGHEARTGPDGKPEGGPDADATGPSTEVAKAVVPPELDEALTKDRYVVSLPSVSFEGPLDLLLQIIQKHELDILDIPIGFITEKYLAYLDAMQTLTIDVASEYLVMAATLAFIKSKMLLPDVPSDTAEDGIEEEEEDPRAELVRRLLEYQKYKAAAEELGGRDTLGSAIFPRGQSEPEEKGPAPFAAFNVVDLLDAFSKILSRTSTKLEHEIVFDRISITERIVELTDLLKTRGSVPFEHIFQRESKSPTRFDIVITFLAVLEMCRLRMMRVFQTGPLAPIHVDLIVVDDASPLDMQSEPPAEEPNVHEPDALDEPAPSAEEVEAPSAEDVEAPIVDEVEAPIADDVEAPIAEEVEVPIAEEVEVPIADEVEAPIAEEIEAPGVDEPPVADDQDETYR